MVLVLGGEVYQIMVDLNRHLFLSRCREPGGAFGRCLVWKQPHTSKIFFFIPLHNLGWNYNSRVL
uniref:Uncharacterized protein n=1 Tax=Nelumbo nucifera TaxID=4432 RepID=A0A822ZUP6_NELNU|nr:TPA_asm: hypothetical protein HUJ06_018630 [Nelumbo nucifera]